MRRNESIKISLALRMIIAQLARFVQEQAQGTATFGQITNVLTVRKKENVCSVESRIGQTGNHLEKKRRMTMQLPSCLDSGLKANTCSDGALTESWATAT